MSKDSKISVESFDRKMMAGLQFNGEIIATFNHNASLQILLGLASVTDEQILKLYGDVKAMRGENMEEVIVTLESKLPGGVIINSNDMQQDELTVGRGIPIFVHKRG